MAKHHPDLIFCRKQPGVAIGRLCDKCAFLFSFFPTNHDEKLTLRWSRSRHYIKVAWMFDSFSRHSFLRDSSYSGFLLFSLFRKYCVFFCAGDGRCVICDSYVRPCTLVRICDECNYGSYQGR